MESGNNNIFLIRENLSSMTKDTQKKENLSFKVPFDVYDYLTLLAKRERRTVSEIARAMVERGIAAQKRDKRIFEPEEEQVQQKAR